MKPVAWIALNVFRESVRDKVLYNLVFFAVLLIGASYLIGQLTAAHWRIAALLLRRAGGSSGSSRPCARA